MADTPETPIAVAISKVTESGLNSTVKAFQNLSWSVFGMLIIWTIMQWYHSSEEASRILFEKTAERQWESLNTTNHNLAGMSNAVAEMIPTVRALKEEVSLLKAELARPATKEKVGGTVRP